MKQLLLQENVAHYPQLNTILMVEESLQKLDGVSKTQLWKSLPKSVMWQTLNVILSYLESSGKILFDRQGKIVWTYDPEGARKWKKKSRKEGLFLMA